MSTTIRIFLASIISFALAYHGYKKKSLDVSGSAAAVAVGFVSFACSYRFGVILILFYYTSSKLTKVKETVKAVLEDGYLDGGQRNWIQVLANSLLSTCVAVVYFIYIGEDININYHNTNAGNSMVSVMGHSMSKDHLASQLSCMYLAHYACCTADTWASEIGILSTSQPRLVTSFFIRSVPHGTNGGVSWEGTLASALGGAFIGLVSLAFSYLNDSSSMQYGLLAIGLISGISGSLFDSLLGATCQATYYSKDRRCIIKDRQKHANDKSIVVVCGIDLLSNETVNFISIAMTMLLILCIAPFFF